MTHVVHCLFLFCLRLDSNHSSLSTSPPSTSFSFWFLLWRILATELTRRGEMAWKREHVSCVVVMAASRYIEQDHNAQRLRSPCSTINAARGCRSVVPHDILLGQPFRRPSLPPPVIVVSSYPETPPLAGAISLPYRRRFTDMSANGETRSEKAAATRTSISSWVCGKSRGCGKLHEQDGSSARRGVQ